MLGENKKTATETAQIIIQVNRRTDRSRRACLDEIGCNCRSGLASVTYIQRLETVHETEVQGMVNQKIIV
jgi:hypothetical protein